MKAVGARVLVGAMLLTLAPSACSKSEGMPPTDAGASTGLSCQQIRMCVFGAPCADDACVQTCAARGTADARATFEALRACTAMTCPATGDVNCACGEQCQAGGSCLKEADDCLGTAAIDDICDSLCA